MRPPDEHPIWEACRELYAVLIPALHELRGPDLARAMDKGRPIQERQAALHIAMANHHRGGPVHAHRGYQHRHPVPQEDVVRVDCDEAGRPVHILMYEHTHEAQ